MSTAKNKNGNSVAKIPDEREKSIEKLIDPIRSRILNELRVSFHAFPKDVLLKMAKDFAFLSRHYAGANIQPSKVSVPVVDTYSDDEIVAHKMALVVHEKPGKAKVLLQHSSPVEHMSCMVSAMAETAEKAISNILDAEKGKPVFGAWGTQAC